MIYNKPKIDNAKGVNQLESNWKDYIPSLIYGPAILTQFFLIFFTYNYINLDILIWVGWALICFFIILGGLPRQAFKRYGGIEKGKSHVYTTKLVDKGIYAIIRHPYWLSWILISLSLIFLSQYWIMIIIGTLACIIIYSETYLLDRRLIKKFGSQYIEYRKKVPRLNIILGIIKYLKK